MLVAAAMAASLGAGAIGIGTTFAAEKAVPARDAELASAIATKFGIDVNDVRAVIAAQFKAHRDEAKAAREQRLGDAIAQAVTDGKLTQAQADAVASKRDEVKAYMESIKGEDAETRHADVKAEIESLKSWSDENGIPKEFARFVLPPRAHGAGHGMRGNMMTHR